MLSGSFRTHRLLIISDAQSPSQVAQRPAEYGPRRVTDVILDVEAHAGPGGALRLPPRQQGATGSDRSEITGQVRVAD